jgi:hypothetical protein
MRSRIFLLLGLLAPSVSLAEPAAIGTTVPVLGKYTAPESDKDSKPRGISGMGCLGRPGDASRECLVINDEETSGEVAFADQEGADADREACALHLKEGANDRCARR